MEAVINLDMQSTQDRKARNRAIVAILGASSGNLVEWFDFYTYSFTALYFAPAFFPAGNRTTQLMNAAGIFAIGFLMRPLGGWLFGRIGDRHGRRTSMLISVLMMCAGSLMVALLPTYAVIGAAAPVFLLIARLIQGLSVGGEYGTCATYMSEVALAGHRGFYSSFQYVTLIGGQLLAVLSLVVLQQILSPAQLQAWGWRIPFLLGAVGALVALFLRRSLVETTSSESRRHESAGKLSGLWVHRRALVTVFGFTAGGLLIFYTFTTYMQKYLVNTAGMSAGNASMVMTAALFVFMVSQPLFGALSDRIGRRSSMICFSLLAVFTTVPLLHALGTVTSPFQAFWLLLVALGGISFYSSIGGIVKAELFPMEVRALGVGLPYAIANAAFGGTAEYVALWFKSAGQEESFFWYVTALCAVALIVSFQMPDPRRHGYLRDEADTISGEPSGALVA